MITLYSDPAAEWQDRYKRLAHAWHDESKRLTKEISSLRHDLERSMENHSATIAELAALRAEVASAHAAQRHAEKELSQYMAWYAMAEHQHLHEQRRAEKAEAEVERLRAEIKSAPHGDACGIFTCARPMVERDGTCDAYWLEHIVGGPWHEFVSGECNCWKAKIDKVRGEG